MVDELVSSLASRCPGLVCRVLLPKLRIAAIGPLPTPQTPHYGSPALLTGEAGKESWDDTKDPGRELGKDLGMDDREPGKTDQENHRTGNL